MLVALVVRYPQAFTTPTESARANAALDIFDREVGGGNSVFPDQALLVRGARLIPADGTFAVRCGPPQDGWTDLTVPFAETLLRYFLLPRTYAIRTPAGSSASAAIAAHTRARQSVWEGDDGLAILKRAS